MLLWLVALQAVGLYLFLDGFLLTRTVISDKSPPRAPHAAVSTDRAEEGRAPASDRCVGSLLAATIVRQSVWHTTQWEPVCHGALLAASPPGRLNISHVYHSTQLPPSVHSFCERSCAWVSPRFRRAVVIVIDALRHDFIYFNSTAEEIAKETGRPTAPYVNKMPTLNRLLNENQGEQTWLSREIWLPSGTRPATAGSGRVKEKREAGPRSVGGKVSLCRLLMLLP